MRTYRVGLILSLVFPLFAGCASVRPDPNVTEARAQIGGPYGGFVNFWTRKVDDHTYEIVVYGRADLTDDQFLDGWIWMANKLAAGRPYEKQTKTDHLRYEGMSLKYAVSTPGPETEVTGLMVLK
jgi:hypothetical protein